MYIYIHIYIYTIYILYIYYILYIVYYIYIYIYIHKISISEFLSTVVEMDKKYNGSSVLYGI